MVPVRSEAVIVNSTPRPPGNTEGKAWSCRAVRSMLVSAAGPAIGVASREPRRWVIGGEHNHVVVAPALRAERRTAERRERDDGSASNRDLLELR